MNNTTQPAWILASEIVAMPHHHSTALDVRPLLLALPMYESPKEGWYLGGLLNEFRVSGSPSEARPTHFMPMPAKPSQ